MGQRNTPKSVIRVLVTLSLCQQWVFLIFNIFVFWWVYSLPTLSLLFKVILVILGPLHCMWILNLLVNFYKNILLEFLMGMHWICRSILGRINIYYYHVFFFYICYISYYIYYYFYLINYEKYLLFVLRYNSYITKLTILRCTIQWFLHNVG